MKNNIIVLIAVLLLFSIAMLFMSVNKIDSMQKVLLFLAIFLFVVYFFALYIPEKIHISRQLVHIVVSFSITSLVYAFTKSLMFSIVVISIASISKEGYDYIVCDKIRLWNTILDLMADAIGVLIFTTVLRSL